jgi:uncharacterized protein
VPLATRGEEFLFNTLTDAQLARHVRRGGAARSRGAGEFVGAGRATAKRSKALETLAENGFLVESRDADQQALDQFLGGVKSDTTELNVTLLTTLQCNFACDYCFQGDHGDYNKFAEKMTLATAERVAVWMERELDRVRPERLVLTFFGGEPLLNLPAMYLVTERMWEATQARAVEMYVNIITNGLLLTADVVDRMLPFGFERREDHARRRPRHPQPDAARCAAARAPSTASSRTSATSRIDARFRSAATSTRARSTAIRRCSRF